MKAATIKEAWTIADELFPTDYSKDEQSSQRAGYPVYRSTADQHTDYICDLGDRLEVNLSNGKSVNIWIDAPAKQDALEMSQERKDLAKRLQRAAYWYTEEYVKELSNKAKEDATVKEMQEADDGSEIRCVVLTAEQNANVMLDCIQEVIRAVNILLNKEEDVEDWMLAGINAMMDKCNDQHIIPFDLPASICGILGAEWRD